jgi:hypothetical protein
MVGVERQMLIYFILSFKTLLPSIKKWAGFFVPSLRIWFRNGERAGDSPASGGT